MNLFGGKSKILGLLFILAAFASFYLGDILTFPVSKKWMAGMILVVAVLFIALFVLRPKKTEQDVIAEEDERNQYIELKCAAAACPDYVEYLLGCLLQFWFPLQYKRSVRKVP